MVKTPTYLRLLVIISFLCSCSLTQAQTNTAPATTANWSTAAWSLGIAPGLDTNVVIPVGAIITVDVNTELIGDITVNGTLIVNNAASVSLNIKGNISVGAGGTITNNGRIEVFFNNLFNM